MTATAEINPVFTESQKFVGKNGGEPNSREFVDLATQSPETARAYCFSVFIPPSPSLPDGCHPDTSSSMGLPRFPVRLPSVAAVLYYAPFQKHAIDPSLDLWPEAYNQCHPLPLALNAVGKAKRGGMFALLKLTTGRYLALLPLVTDVVMSWLQGDGETGFELAVNHFGNAPLTAANLPLLSAAESASPYAAIEMAWDVARRASPDGFRLRNEKHYHPLFSHLGWCTWEQFRDNIDEQTLLDAIDEIDHSNLPIRWVLIDDGHLDQAKRDGLITSDAGGEAPVDSGKRRLNSFSTDREKFPNGWVRIQERMRNSRSIKWSGIWLNFNGYWGGIASHNQFGDEMNHHFIESHTGCLLPKNDAQSASGFYDTWIKQQADAGFDFVKVDNEAQNVTLYRGCCENAVQATRINHAALERAVNKHLKGMINCMAHNNLCAFSTAGSQITRCSEDYKKEDAWRAKHHLHNSFGNMLWMGQTVWGDHDMFHSSDRVAGALMARSKAISGGPVYLSDHPDNFVRDLIAPLHLSDGRLLRPLAPAVPLPESVFMDPYEDDDAYRVIAPLPHGCAALAAYNLTHPEKDVCGRWHRDDLRHREAMLSPRFGSGRDARATPGQQVLLYDTLARTIRLLTSDNPEVAFTLAPLTDAFVIMSPVVRGWAIIGNPEKYLPPSFVSRFEISSDGATTTLAGVEAGSVFVWHIHSGLRQIGVPSGQQSVIISQ
ncbi:alpha-galactosidase [Opitutaceae bacterium TAV1]|nr:alpha-galactosidase [Opitutaceae bacterium TAV1]